MYAIIQGKDKQYKVTEGQRLVVGKMDSDAQTDINFDKVLFVGDNVGAANAGSPFVEGASVDATVISHFRGDKVIIFKKKRRKGHRKKQGHRQDYTLIQIKKINA